MTFYHSKGAHRPDYFLMALVLVITVFGFIMLASASSELGKIHYNDSYYYVRHQLLYGLSFGIAGFLLASFVRYGLYRALALPMLIFTILLLLLVFTPLGIEANNATRWLHLGPIRFQPAELLKLTLILYLAAWLSRPNMQRSSSLLKGLLPFLVVLGIVGALLVRQPATSTVLILFGTGMVLYFLSGAKFRYIAGTMLLILVSIGLIIYATPYRRERIMGFLQPGQHQETKNFQVSQSLIAIGAGGFTGAGYGRSLIKSTLPASVDDSIFAVIGEELGFAGSASLVALFAALVFRFFWLARRAPDLFGRLMLAGFGTVIALQSLVNMGAISGILPLTGVPLPFISYGGTALAVFLTMTGVAANVSKYT
ncbi:MAG: cell division protein FtsW [Candidatus Liptonbacteria bacterium]|nr:cell division protein FtsW [Candidatus Liptonbacteria bacterium]